MKKIFKSIFIFLSLFVVMLICENASAFTITSESTGLYFTFMKENGHRFSDEAKVYYVDGRLAYCIEPGIAMGSNDYYIGDLNHLSEEKKRRIEELIYYGYKYKTNIYYESYLATQALIWEELLPEGTKVVFSTELFEKGIKRDISVYKNLVNDEINKKKKIHDLSDYQVQLNESIELNNLIDKPEDFDIIYDHDAIDITFTGNRYMQIAGKKIGTYKVDVIEKDYYNSPYLVYKHDNKQDLLLVGNIELNKKSFNVTVNGGTLILNKEDVDTYELLPNATYGLYTMNNELLYELTTNEDGTISTDSQIPYGMYYLKELVAPIGYEINDYKTYIKFDENNKIINISLMDKKIEGNIIINKYDADNNEVISNTEFTILDDNNNVIDKITTDETGKANIKLKYGKYYFQESNVNDNYILDDALYDVNINESIDYVFNIYNKKVPVEEEEELVINDVPNTNSISIYPYLLIIGVIIVKKEVCYYICNN